MLALIGRRPAGPVIAALLALWVTLGCAPATPQPLPAHASAASFAQHAPTLDDLWAGRAHFVVDVANTGLPMGESDTVLLADGTLRAYLHASTPSLGVIDACGQPVEFPGCVVLFASQDGGRSFAPVRNTAGAVACQIPCRRCPCTSQQDHVDQQQYPRVAVWTGPAQPDRPAWVMVYEYRANTILRRSGDGLTWSQPAEVPLTGIWRDWLMPCRPEQAVGPHPHTPAAFDCLSGSPPGLYIDTTPAGPELYLFVGMGQNPGALGCYRGPLATAAVLLRQCDQNPLFTGSPDYGPLDQTGAAANPHFDFRTISSAEVLRVGTRYYLFYEGVRGPQAGDAGDTQFGLGLARSTGDRIDGPWERFPGNPLLVDLPGNVGLGHADVVVLAGTTYLYTSLDGRVRSRLLLVWN
jgi:hypothetical protein